ncbi:hypothetical protein OIU79_016127 [Salix purpurea]|uniref:Uncharacterized protein n=1 Tax=Salix purpurea TaxID=77065 RepID=A0A9Q0SR14_SALPP|nr:hypothetical protein OIU79_016127 [Salix purpurea]
MKAKTSIKNPVHLPHDADASTELVSLFSKKESKLGCICHRTHIHPPRHNRTKNMIYEIEVSME